MERYVLLNGERWPDDTRAERHAILAVLSKNARLPTFELVWRDVNGLTRAVDVIVVGQPELKRARDGARPAEIAVAG
jgi:hypothetical protein